MNSLAKKAESGKSDGWLPVAMFFSRTGASQRGNSVAQDLLEKMGILMCHQVVAGMSVTLSASARSSFSAHETVHVAGNRRHSTRKAKMKRPLQTAGITFFLAPAWILVLTVMKDMISVIIPACNDEGPIQKTISFLKNNAYTRLLQEIIVVDSGSADSTVRAAIESGAKVVRSISSHRAAMMNLGAENATGKILYFLIPGAIPPANYCTEIVRATLNNFSFGLFTTALNDRHWVYKAASWISDQRISFARLDHQSLFVMRELFEKAGRFRQDLAIMEDRELIMRMKRYSGYIILKEKIIAPAHSYLKAGTLRSELGYLTAVCMRLAGYPEEKLLKIYNRLSGKNKAATNKAEIRASLT